MGTRPTPSPFSTRASTALAGWGHVPSPVPPQRAEVTGGEEHTSPPLAVVTGEHRRRSGGPAGREREERRGDRRRRRECEPDRPGPGSEVIGARAAHRARALRRRRAPAQGPAAAPRAGRIRGGAKMTAATVNEGRETRDPSRAREVRAASRVGPRRRRRTRV
jgi:hypothetical protein